MSLTYVPSHARHSLRRNSCSIFSSDGHFVYQSGTILAILVEDHQSDIPISLNEIGSGVTEVVAFKDFSIF